MHPIAPVAPYPVAAPAATPVTAPPAADHAPRGDFGAVLESRMASSAPPLARPVAAAALSTLQGIERAQARLDAIVAAARSGRTFTGAELLALQAQAHRFAQTVELTARLVEHGVQAVRQSLQAQV